jgi:hypothetical protein
VVASVKSTLTESLFASSQVAIIRSTTVPLHYPLAKVHVGLIRSKHPFLLRPGVVHDNFVFVLALIQVQLLAS